MKKIILSAMLGNVLEWYDYALYVQFASIIGLNFFPCPESQELFTFIVFAAGFFVRPFGGIILGNIGDRFGRRTALFIAIILMTFPTACIGLLPNYQTIGLMAPITLVFIRLLQGFSLGGEFSGCISYIVEHSELENRGLVGSASFISMCIGMFFGLATGSLCYFFIKYEILISWGWRLPFISGIFIGFIGFYFRKNLSESPIYENAKISGKLSKFPLHETCTKYFKKLLLSIGLYIAVTAPFYIATVFIVNFMKNLGYSEMQTTLINTTVLFIMIISLPISAFLSDRIGRRPILISGLLLMFLLIYPVFWALESMNFLYALISQFFFALALGIYMGPIPTVLVEIFPTSIRFTGIALSYNFSAALFGGTAPAVSILLIKLSEDYNAPSYYLMFLMLFSFISLIFLKESYRKDLAV